MVVLEIRLLLGVDVFNPAQAVVPRSSPVLA